MSKSKSQVNTYLVKGNVLFSGKNPDGKNSVTIKLSEELAEKIRSAMNLDEQAYEGTPIKESEEGITYFKASSNFEVTIYDNGTEITGEITLDEIGEDSIVEIFIGIKETKYRSKTYQVAYLKSINIIKQLEKIKFNPFDNKDSNLTSIE